MKKNFILDDDEINLSALFEVIWNSKIKILFITIISFLIGFGYSYQTPNNYLTSLTISKNNNSEFSDIAFINRLLISNNEKPEIGQAIFNKFIYELKDYDEFLIILKNSKEFKENFSKLSLKAQKRELFKYQKLLKIVKRSELKLSFKWHDKNEALDILQDTIKLTLNNLEKLLYKELLIKLENKKKLSNNSNFVRLNYLKKQRRIAKELNVKDHIYGYTGNPYYLRGYRAIDKEIEIIKSQQDEEFKFINQEINSIKKKESINWVVYDINSIQQISLKDTKLIYIISILIGLVTGVFFVLIFNEFQSQNILKKRTN